ncbi:hypothetical protein GE061_007738, partial [Apolygus lucorum]
EASFHLNYSPSQGREDWTRWPRFSSAGETRWPFCAFHVPFIQRPSLGDDGHFQCLREVRKDN